MLKRRFWLWAFGPVIIIALAAVWLGAQYASGHTHTSLRMQTVTQHFKPEGCDDQCPTVKVKTLEFNKAPELTRTLRERLLRMTPGKGDGQSAPSADFHAYAQQLFQENRKIHRQYPDMAPYSAQFEAKAVSQHDGLLVLRLDAYIFVGGAHGMPLTRYMVIEKRDKRILSLAAMLRPGQQAAFNKVLRAVHARWQRHQSLDASYWSFTPSDNVAPLRDNLAVTYQAYDIAPYAFGQPTLHIPYGDLRGILKPRFLPDHDSS